MADPELGVLEREENTVSIDAVSVRRFINDAIKEIAPEIDPTNIQNISAINALASGVIEFMNRAPDNQTTALEALETNIISALKNGPTDDLMPRVEEMLNLIMQGAADGKFVTADSQNQVKKEDLRREKERSAALTTAAILEAAEIDPIKAKHFNNYINDNWTDNAEITTNALIDAITNNTSPEELRDKYEDHLQALHEILKNDETFSNMSPEMQAAYLENSSLDKLAEKMDMSVDELKEKLSSLDPDIAQKIIANSTQAFASNYIATTTAELTALASRANSMVESGVTQAQTLTDGQIDSLVINFKHTYNEDDYLAVYAGTAISEDGMSLINDGSDDIKYYSVTDDGKFYEFPLEYAIAQSPDQGAVLADQIEASGFQFDQLDADLQTYIAEIANVHNQTEMLAFLRETDNSHPVLMSLMGNEDFITTVGSYALQTGIEVELENGQVFANDPRLEELLELTPDDIISQQQDAIDELVKAKDEMQTSLDETPSLDQWLSSYLSNEIEQLDSQITAMTVQLEEYKTAVEKIAIAEHTIDDLSAAQEAFDPDGLGLDPLTMGGGFSSGIMSPIATTQDRIDYQLGEIEAAQATIDQIEGEIDTETADAPAPAPDTAQAALDKYKEEIIALMTGNPSLSQEELIKVLPTTGIPEHLAADVIQLAANLPEVQEHYKNTGSSLDINGNMSPQEMTLAANEPTANNPTEPVSTIGMRSI